MNTQENSTGNLAATAKQRAMLKLAIQNDWLYPNPFTNGNYDKWQKLTKEEADKLLDSIPEERRKILEKELKSRKFDAQKAARRTGHEVEEITRQIGHAIDGGM